MCRFRAARGVGQESRGANDEDGWGDEARCQRGEGMGPQRGVDALLRRRP